MFLANKNLLQFSRIAFLGSEVVSDNMIYAREAQTQKDRNRIERDPKSMDPLESQWLLFSPKKRSD